MLSAGESLSLRAANAALPAGSKRLALNSKLLDDSHATVVQLSRWGDHRLRYFSLLRTEGPTPGKPLRGKALVARGCKDCKAQGTVNGMDWFTTYIIGGLDDGGEAPKEVVHDYSMSHNLVIRPSSDGRRFYGMGGQDGGKMYGSGGKGPGYTSSTELREGVRIVAADSWSAVLGGAWLHPKHESGRSHADSATLSFNGHHDGCSDAHSNGRRCEFDGKMSLVEFRGRWLAYARSNMLNWGGRFVQVAATSGDDPTGAFGKFQNIDIAGYDPKGPGNVYFGAVDVNPVDRETVVGLFPVNEGQRGSVNANGDTYVGMAISCDGVHFSPFVKLIQSQGKEGRTYDQPVDGFAVDGTDVRFFVHLDVEHISPNADTQSRIEQYTFKTEALRAITRGVRQALVNCRPVRN